MLIKKYRSSILIILYVLISIYFFVLGDNGILERMRLVQAKDEIKTSIARLTQENNKLQKENTIISNNQTNSSFYKEEASKSGYISKGEKYIFFKGTEKKERPYTESDFKEENYPVKIGHLRILWIIISIFILSLYFWKKNKEKNNLEENLKV